MKEPGPLCLQSIFLNKIWAAQELASPWSVFWSAPANTGEIWLASDQDNITPIAEGTLKGLGLDEVIARWPIWILGNDDGQIRFPLLLKILNVGNWLSIQVHPSDEIARRLENRLWGKSEAWFVLEACAESEIIMGFKPGINRLTVKHSLIDGMFPKLLGRISAQAGDTFYLSAGTVHSIGPGLIIFEIQQSSNVTYRFYDWDRLNDNNLPRTLQQSKALEAMAITEPGHLQLSRILAVQPNLIELLVHDPHFALLKVTIEYAYKLYWGGKHPRILFIKQGKGQLSSRIREFKTLDIVAGQTWLLPAGLNEVEILPIGLDLVILECVGLKLMPRLV